MATKKIIVFLGSTREGRQGEKVARYVQSVLEKTGLSAKIFGKYLTF
jgi:NAD(P)H-dependent FMN reductase